MLWLQRCQSSVSRVSSVLCMLAVIEFVFLGHLTCRAWSGLGGNHHPTARQRASCLPVRHHSQRSTVCRVDLSPSQTGGHLHKQQTLLEHFSNHLTTA